MWQRIVCYCKLLCRCYNDASQDLLKYQVAKSQCFINDDTILQCLIYDEIDYLQEQKRVKHLLISGTQNLSILSRYLIFSCQISIFLKLFQLNLDLGETLVCTILSRESRLSLNLTLSIAISTWFKGPRF